MCLKKWLSVNPVPTNLSNTLYLQLLCYELKSLDPEAEAEIPTVGARKVYKYEQKMYNNQEIPLKKTLELQTQSY